MLTISRYFKVRFGCKVAPRYFSPFVSVVSTVFCNTVQSYNIITTYPNIVILKNVKWVKIVVLRQKQTKNGIHQKRYSYTSMEITASMQPILLYNMQPYIYTHVRTSIEYHTKNIVLKNAKTLAISKYCRIFAAQTNNNNNKNIKL